MKLHRLGTLLGALALSAALALPRLGQGPLHADGAAARAGGSAAVAQSVAVDAGGSAGLAASLDEIDVEGLRADLRFVASDEMGGRDTPSEGLRRTARYIRSRLERLGFTPGGDDGFFDRYRLVVSELDTRRTAAVIHTKDGEVPLAFGEDYVFGREGVVDLETAGDVVFVGSGTPEDLDEVQLAGCWALAYDDGVRAERELLEDLERRRAVGVIFATPPSQDDRHDASRAAGTARWVGRERLRPLVGAIFPEVSVSRETFGKLTRGVGGRLVPGTRVGARFQDVRATTVKEGPHDVENVCGLWPGSDPELAREVIVVSAHYDHVGVRRGEIYNGADDNGSGTCGLMALAEALAAHGAMKRSILLLWVSGEEKGLLGSKAWTMDPTLPSGMRAVCNLNIDMIGRNAPDYLLITPTRDHDAYNGLTRMAEKFAPLEGFPKLGSCDDYWTRSDHMNFSEQLGIPVAFLFSDVHEDYHKPTDTVDKIDFDKIRRVTRLVFRMLDALQDMDLAELRPK